MGLSLEKHYREWIPASLFSYFLAGILSGCFLENFYPDLTLVWISVHAIIIIFLSLRERKSKKILFLSWGTIFFLFLAVCGYTKRSAPFLSESQIWKKGFQSKIETLLDEANIQNEAREISLGLVLGDAKNLSKDFKKKAKEGGILHLFAASGLHLGILIGCLFSLFKRMPFLGYSLPRILPVLLGFLYLAMLGFPISLARAWVFSTWILLQSLLFRRSRPTDLLLISAGILYLWDPDRSFGVSFLLSFGAVAGILLLLPSLKHCLPKIPEEKTILSRFLGFWRENLAVSTAAGLGTLPSLIYYFGSYSFGSLGLNLILVPVCGILLPLLYFSLLLQACSLSILAKPIWQIVVSLLEFLERTTLFWSELDLSLVHYYRGKTKFFALGIWTLFLLFLFLWKWIGAPQEEEDVELDLTLSETDPFVKRRGAASLSKNRIQDRTIPKFNRVCLSHSSFPAVLRKRIWILGFAFCFFFQVTLARSSYWIEIPPVFFGDKFSFVLQEERKLSLIGKCKYSSKIFYRSFGRDPELFCGDHLNTREIYIEHESCLQWISECVRRRKDLSLKYGGKDKPKIAGFENWIRVPKAKEFSLPTPAKKMIRFEVGKDSLIELGKSTKAGSGIILLLPRFNIPEDPRQWNRVRKQLGIGPGWKFIGSDELPGIPVL
ncbi:ComEC/Rec2 family competence protein [Leptospira langatensis]|uniref:ComEC/Rec2 family competence protein n=1 Tax=Leptospira langatensis TaxID=2484983 RepID=A0A5F1ZX93_9LEPT|nr:ComEC/Rec2 family competence protein [Leptospira langatensis]TGK01341.1 ComEC/Rec2 family competence protein [Leptospira langatensis]TGL42207.1 ComEC/Rec2 family competence protein [Leptospira langatensis]